METDRNNISTKFKEIKDKFSYPTNKNNLKINQSYSNFNKRPKLTKNNHKSIDKTDLNNILDQIGNEDLIFNNDKLITNIKIESFDNSLKKNSIISIENDKSFISKKTNKTNSIKLKKNRHKNNFSQNRNESKELSNTSNRNLNSLELNCNKMPFNNANIKKQLNHNIKNGKKNKSSAKSKNVCVKNVNQFINKPNEVRKSSNQSYLMTPINKKSMGENNNKRFFKNIEFHSSQRSFINFNNNDSISLASTSRMDMSKSFVRGRSMPPMRLNKSQSNLRLPNKSVIKNQDKIIIELQKLFGEKILLSEDTYHNLTEYDKKNFINFLLESIKELDNTNKLNKTKTEGYKQIIETKEQAIKNYKNEIKELKKENLKLNKIIRSNNQLNKKLNQNIDSLKLQLEKEKMKNKTLQMRDKSTSKINKIQKENSINKLKRHTEFKSQDKIKKASDFVNCKKTENSKEKTINNKNNSEINILNNKKNINIIWKNNEENKAHNSPNSLLINDPKKKNGFEVNSQKLVKVQYFKAMINLLILVLQPS